MTADFIHKHADKALEANSFTAFCDMVGGSVGKKILKNDNVKEHYKTFIHHPNQFFIDPLVYPEATQLSHVVSSFTAKSYPLGKSPKKENHSQIHLIDDAMPGVVAGLKYFCPIDYQEKYEQTRDLRLYITLKETSQRGLPINSLRLIRTGTGAILSAYYGEYAQSRSLAYFQNVPIINPYLIQNGGEVGFKANEDTLISSIQPLNGKWRSISKGIGSVHLSNLTTPYDFIQN